MQGGYIEEMYRQREVGKKQIDFETAVEKAQQFLKQRGYYNMKESYYVTSGGVCTINFAYEQDGTVCYSDLIKVGVALDTGEVMTFNASGYLMNHYEREIAQPKLEQAQAQESLSPLLKSESARRAVIPTGGTSEVSCYEFTCKGEGDDRVLVYINADTGLEEQIFILLQSDGGTLVI
jgi:hypothetical protein